MKITVVAVGKIRDPRVQGLCEEYSGRLAHHLTVDEVEVKKGRGTPREVKDTEGESLLSACPDGALKIALTERGKNLTSEEVADKLQDWMHLSRDVIFLVGGAYGLSRTVLKSCDGRWSLSAMTFPHDIARMLLYEQLYRGMSILRGEPYHKA